MKKVVVVGGGFTGASVARQLQDRFDVTLIDAQEYFEFTPGVLRVLVEPSYASKIHIKHKSYLAKGRFICGRASDVTKKYVKVGNKRIKFDYLVIASGSRYDVPIKNTHVVLASRGAVLKKYHKKLLNARDIVIVGGGVVGVELAGEICTNFPNKKVSMVESGQNLIQRNHPRAASYANNFLEKRGVRIIFNEIVKEQRGRDIITNNGARIAADLIFFCTGITRNSEFMKKHFSHVLDERRAIEVNQYLQIEGEKNIFAGGDVTGIVEEKTAQSSEKQADVIAKNIKNLEHGRKLETYHSKRRPMVISLGKFDGIFEYKNFVMTGLVPAFMKAAIEWKTMMKYR